LQEPWEQVAAKTRRSDCGIWPHNRLKLSVDDDVNSLTHTTIKIEAFTGVELKSNFPRHMRVDNNASRYYFKVCN
jgi:hypothetical protein